MIPKMKHFLHEKEASFILTKKLVVRNNEFESWCMDAFALRNNLDYEWTENDNQVDMILTKEPSLPKEAYRLDISSDVIRIFASCEKGIIWALTTVFNLIQDERVKCLEAYDQPKYAHRGLLLDTVRHFFSIFEVKKIVEEMALVKLNVLHWHLSDDQGFRVESKIFPLLHQQIGNEFYTQEEILDLVKFAKVRGVDVVPEIDMPGHVSAILAAYPMYSCSGQTVKIAKTGGIYPIVLCPGKPETYQFVEALIKEISGLFESEWFHIGGDEAPDREWKSCPHCEKLMIEQHYTDLRQLQGHFSNRIIDLLKTLGKHVICWNDSLEAHNLKVDNEVAVQYWSIQYADTMQKFIENGGKFIYSDMFEIYLDYPSAMSSLEKVYRTKPQIRDSVYTLESSNVHGIEACLWTENIETDRSLEERLFPRLFALAENAWSGNENYKDFKVRVDSYIEKVILRNVHCQSLDEANPVGEKKKAEMLQYTSSMQSALSEEMRALTLEFAKPNQEFSDRFMQLFFMYQGEE